MLLIPNLDILNWIPKIRIFSYYLTRFYRILSVFENRKHTRFLRHLGAGSIGNDGNLIGVESLHALKNGVGARRDNDEEN